MSSSRDDLVPTRVTSGTDAPMSSLGCTKGVDAEGVTSGFLCPDASNASAECATSGPLRLDANIDVGADVFETPTYMGRFTDAEVPRDCSRGIDDLIFVDPEDPDLLSGRADASSFSSSSGSQVSSDDEVAVDEVEETKKAAPTQRVKVRPDPPGSTLSKKDSLQRLREKCRILMPPLVSLLGFLMRFLATHGTCLAQSNPRGIGIYMLSRECGIDMNTDHLSYLTDFRVRGRRDELKHIVTNASGMALIAGFPSKDDHFEDRFFFVEISEKTVEADCIDLVKTRWERRGRKVIGYRHAEGGDADDLDPTAASAGMRSSRPLAPKTPATSTLRPPPSLSSDELAEFRMMSAERVRISSGKGKGIDREPPLKKRMVVTTLAAVVDREASTSGVVLPLVSGLLRDEAYAATKSKASEVRIFP
ncbi:hypothetical protein AALP_AA2G105100 [Arabis alpina]|uniref:Uncharacterized protein n=1 Tax=Arabis alpina TaxID=50452 RepID=A0A087HGK0_ARAAL|nr:hypothetical protein AALP_AA2G105100 [Arabis alpina]